ncbi:hypothetical protein F511_35766 [Dorcoceras hygrometricum]|uniref:Uncharacterized protein n=1 Tax=Dorcoceras hygrometricum TaxID=472368 RepID=A0A2Z7BVJ7_9LAMI|nr:hypothetical protein F511_35766 [Dorcoceras hygrometricum]
MLSSQSRYTSTASKVDNDKQIPQLLFIVLSRYFQQTQESAVVITSRNNSNQFSRNTSKLKTIALYNSNDVVTCHQLALLYTKEPAADRTSKRCRIDPSTGQSADSKISRLIPKASSAMMTSSLLLAASSSRHADIIIAESRFLFASIQQLISSFFALLIPDFYCSSSSSTYLQQTS